MIFPSYIFVLIFLPAMLVAWYGLPGWRLRLFVLTAASYVFYGWWDWRFVALMFGTTAVDYYCGAGLGATDRPGLRRLLMAASLVSNLGCLVFFKYYRFFADSVAAAFATAGLDLQPPVLDVILPLGISFYTFQSLGYVLDVYRRECKPARDFLTFAAYVSMYPQLVAGPIVRYRDIEEQMAQLPERTTNHREICDGIWFFLIGLIKKVWIADRLAPLVAFAFDATPDAGMFTCWAGALAYTFQLYFDFSGYSDMARGLGFMLGFKFPSNFNSPYKASTIADFWNRWHISLSTLLRDNLYIPLGGSRRGHARTLRNLFVTMFLGGLWHGAGWTFVVWGLYHGVLLAVHECWKRWRIARLPRLAAVSVTFVSVVVGWVFFRATSLERALDMLAAMSGLRGVEPLTAFSATLGVHMPAVYAQFGGMHGLAALLGIAALAFLAPNSDQLPKPRHPAWGAALACCLLVMLTSFAKELPFLYFTF
jgi:alginate O-acetyltransferase complex protein AlgI